MALAGLAGGGGVWPVTAPTPNQLYEGLNRSLATTWGQRQAIRAWRYYDGTAYNPAYGRQFPHPYTEWDEVQMGPRPLIRPLAKRIADNSAQFLFGEPPQIVVGDGSEAYKGLQELVDQVIAANGLDEQWLPEARAAAIEGGTVFKFAWTPQVPKRPVAVMSHAPYHVTWQRDVLDAGIVRGVRLRFEYCDGDGQWWLYQEEWTPELHVTYAPLKLRSTAQGLDYTETLKLLVNGQWPGRTVNPNPFGLLPFTGIVNKAVKGSTEGVGDYWDLFPAMDQYNHTCWLEHHSNQIDGDPLTAILNADYDGRLLPGEIVKLSGADADIKRLNPENNLREHIAAFGAALKRDIYQAASSSDADAQEVTNKGNLTRAVWQFIFADELAKLKEKRRHWGPNGLEAFFEGMLLGLSRLEDARRMYPALATVREADPDSYSVSVRFGELFRPTPEERKEVIADAAQSVNAGFLTRERAAKLVAQAWEIQDVSALLEELKEQMERLEAQEQAALDAALAQVDAAKNDGEGAGDA